MVGRTKRYTALGSSFAAGPGILPLVDPIAGRSGRNYPHVVAEALGLDLTDLTVSGATTATILDTPHRTPFGRVYPPQLQGLRSDADLVTVTAGGNDLGYLGGMLFTAWDRTDPGGIFLQTADPDFAHAAPEPSDAAVRRAVSGLLEIVQRVRRRAPAARVVLVDYLAIIGAETRPAPGVPFETAEIELFGRIQTALEAVFATAAELAGVELVRASGISRAHALGSAEPWVNPFVSNPARTIASFHPNAAGMAAVAAELARAIG
ncbi:hypothetical protein LK09_11985 [Microbacterium mangrovi]|uniref:SGNH hydrolase-type esterase domain-containing protein n=1 Tax=Microbacterium mangrovi TaxID=1348253 RepID=A0A0B2A1V5_9MICO|nr:SGNH/GDSL hydrolase family protein [Microbacterium mangrovi]KHK97469.1 hypothetical protein LK09_11985 [Microbacterium mangrovi]